MRLSYGEPLNRLQLFGPSSSTDDGGDPADFTRALCSVRLGGLWNTPLREAEELITATAKLPVTTGGELEGHMAIAAGRAIEVVMEQVFKLQAEARRCFSPEAIAHAERWLAENRPGGDEQ